MEKSHQIAGETFIGPSCNRVRPFKNLTVTEQELLKFCNGDLHLLRVALRTAIRERTRLTGRP